MSINNSALSYMSVNKVTTAKHPDTRCFVATDIVQILVQRSCYHTEASPRKLLFSIAVQSKNFALSLLLYDDRLRNSFKIYICF